MEFGRSGRNTLLFGLAQKTKVHFYILVHNHLHLHSIRSPFLLRLVEHDKTFCCEFPAIPMWICHVPADSSCTMYIFLVPAASSYTAMVTDSNEDAHSTRMLLSPRPLSAAVSHKSNVNVSFAKNPLPSLGRPLFSRRRILSVWSAIFFQNLMDLHSPVLEPKGSEWVQRVIGEGSFPARRSHFDQDKYGTWGLQGNGAAAILRGETNGGWWMADDGRRMAYADHKIHTNNYLILLILLCITWFSCVEQTGKFTPLHSSLGWIISCNSSCAKFTVSIDGRAHETAWTGDREERERERLHEAICPRIIPTVAVELSVLLVRGVRCTYDASVYYSKYCRPLF